ncbi:MAG: hypothetical protein Kow0074_24430 [Candidatus Zixiibacteriota bacterium]
MITTTPPESIGWPRPLPQIILGLVVFWVCLLAISIPGQRLIGDEAWLGEQAYFLVQDGVIRSELFHGYAMQDERILITHKLFILLGALSTSLLGWGITPLRLLSLLAGVATLAILVWELRRSSGRASPARWLIGLAALIGMPLYFKFINLYRPEVMLGLCGLASYVTLARYLEQNKSTRLVASAVLAGAAVLVHVNGMMFIAAGMVVLALHRRWSAVFVYLLLSAAISSLYFVDVIGRWDLLIRQLQHVPSLTAEDFRWSTPFWRVLDEHKRLFRKPEIIFTTLLSGSAFVYAWVRCRQWRRSLLAYAVVAVFGLAAVAQAKTTPYAIPLMPLFALVIAKATAHWLDTRTATPRWVTVSAVVLWSLFLAHSMFENSMTALTGKQDVAADNRRIAELLPRGATVLAPMEFIFNEIDRFDVRAVMLAELLLAGHHDAELSMDQIEDFARQHGITALVFNRRQRDRFGLLDARRGDRYGSFVVAASMEDGTIVLLHAPAARYGMSESSSPHGTCSVPDWCGSMPSPVACCSNTPTTDPADSRAG